MVGQNVYQPNEIQFILEKMIAGKDSNITIKDYEKEFGKTLTANQLRYVKNKYGKDPKYGTVLINTSIARKRKRTTPAEQPTPTKKKAARSEDRAPKPDSVLPPTTPPQVQHPMATLDPALSMPPVELSVFVPNEVPTPIQRLQAVQPLPLEETLPPRPLRRTRIQSPIHHPAVPHVQAAQNVVNVPLQLQNTHSQAVQIYDNDRLVSNEHYAQATKAAQGAQYYPSRSAQTYATNYSQPTWAQYLPQSHHAQGNITHGLTPASPLYHGVPPQGGWMPELGADLNQEFAAAQQVKLEQDGVAASGTTFVSSQGIPSNYAFQDVNYNDYNTQPPPRQADPVVQNTLAPVMGNQLPPLQTTAPQPYAQQMFEVMEPRSDDLSTDDQNAAYRNTNIWQQPPYIIPDWYERDNPTQQCMPPLNDRLHSSPEAAHYRPNNETGYPLRNTTTTNTSAAMQHPVTYALSPPMEQPGFQANTGPTVVNLASSPSQPRSEHNVPDYALSEPFPTFLPSQTPASGMSPNNPRTLHASGSRPLTRSTIDPRILRREATFSPNTEMPQTPSDSDLIEVIPKPRGSVRKEGE